jgi:hypothetical protein
MDNLGVKSVILTLQRIRADKTAPCPWARSAQDSFGTEAPSGWTPGKKRFCYPFEVTAIFCALVRMNA